MHGGHAADALVSVGYSSSAVQPASLSDSMADDKTPTGSFFFSHPVSAATLSVAVCLSCDW